jgi:hypothetical protein
MRIELAIILLPLIGHEAALMLARHHVSIALALRVLTGLASDARIKGDRLRLARFKLTFPPVRAVSL